MFIYFTNNEKTAPQLQLPHFQSPKYWKISQEELEELVGSEFSYEPCYHM